MSTSLSSDNHAPVAQLDRVIGYEPIGQEFESLRVRHFLSKKHKTHGSLSKDSVFCRLYSLRFAKVSPNFYL